MMNAAARTLCLLLPLAAMVAAMVAAPAKTIQGKVVDHATGDLLPARLYIRGAGGKWHHARSADNASPAVPYEVRRGLSIEVHTSLPARAFVADLPPGRYTLTAERGKEYLPATGEIVVPADAGAVPEITLRLRRWSNMAARGWFSGETHVHRTVRDLPTLLLAEDLNVALPLTAWVTDSRAAPSRANKNPDPVPPAKLIEVDSTHVIWPVNTEYEIFSIDGKGHTLGAVFILNHREAFELTAPPVKPIAAEARRQGALLDLDKHNWPWSMMLVPAMGVQLFELTNNHLWRTRFLFTDFFPQYREGDLADGKSPAPFTERGWIDFGFRNYYTLLNCGFEMKPTAGTASGVHPVPLGFGRVYVKIDGGFSYGKWIRGLAAGQSFVTTGPMLTSEATREGKGVRVRGTYESPFQPASIEIVVNGEVEQQVKAQPERTPEGAFRLAFDTELELAGSSWVAVRAFENRPDGRPRFAHTAPAHFQIEGEPLRPRRAEVEYLIKRVADEIGRHEGVLGDAPLADYRKALEHYRGLLENAR